LFDLLIRLCLWWGKEGNLRDKTIAESGIWILKCRCGNEIKIKGENIEPGSPECPVCKKSLNMVLIQSALTILINFYKQIEFATTRSEDHETWEKITPPPFL